MQKPILSKGVITLLALVLAGIIALIAYLIMRGPIPDEPLAPRGAPPKPQLTAATAGPDSIALSWAPIDQVQQYNLQHIDPKNDSVTAVEQLEGAVTLIPSANSRPTPTFASVSRRWPTD